MKPVDRPDEWDCVLRKAFAHVTSFFGGDYEAALHAIKQALVSGRIAAMVRPLTDLSKGFVLSVEFWQPPRLSSVGLGHITVLSKEYPSGVYRFFLRQSDLEKVWPVSGGSGATTAPATPDTTDATSDNNFIGTAGWITAEAKRMKAAGEIRDGIRKTNFAKLLAARMRKAARSDESLRVVGSPHIKNNLSAWGLWPISVI